MRKGRSAATVNHAHANLENPAVKRIVNLLRQ
jgi:hypothetical protein